MSNDPRENLHGSKGQDLADLEAAAEQAGARRAASTPATPATGDASAQGPAVASFEDILRGTTPEADASCAQDAQEGAAALAEDGAQDLRESLESDGPLLTQEAVESATEASQDLAPAAATSQNEVVLAPAPTHLPAAKPRPWYRSRRSFSAKGRGGRVQVAGLGVTYMDHVTGATLLANIDLGFRARSLSAILDPTGRRARALFLILAGLEEPQAGRIIAAPSRSLAARLAGRIGSVALIREDSPLDESLTIRQNILAPLSATGSVADWDNLVGALQITGLAQRVDARPSELSDWERFKAIIARSIVSGAEVFLVEDPSSLPAAARDELGSLLRSLTDAGCAVVIATSDAEVAAASDRAILLANGRVALDAPNPSAAIIAASLAANPEDPKALLGPVPSALPASFDEVVSPTGAQAPAWHPLGIDSASTDEAPELTAGERDAEPTDAADAPEAGLDAVTTRVEAAPTQEPQASPEPRTETALRGIPVVESGDPALAESEVSDLVVRARKILSDLPGSIAPQE